MASDTPLLLSTDPHHVEVLMLLVLGVLEAQNSFSVGIEWPLLGKGLDLGL